MDLLCRTYAWKADRFPVGSQIGYFDMKKGNGRQLAFLPRDLARMLQPGIRAVNCLLGSLHWGSRNLNTLDSMRKRCKRGNLRPKVTVQRHQLFPFRTSRYFRYAVQLTQNGGA